MTKGENEGVRRVTTDELSAADIRRIRALLVAAFGDDDEEAFTEDDWQHAVGGVHFVLDERGAIVAHASVVERELHVGGTPLRTGYVEAVAVTPERQRQGLGTRVMRAVNAHIFEQFDLGALGTGRHRFYHRLGWQTWRGQSSVRLPDGRLERTPDEDGSILVLATPSSPTLDRFATISCAWRPGDVW